MPAAGLSTLLRRKMFFEVLRIRMVEEAIAERYPENKMRCPTHFSVGQESVAVGVCNALTVDDYLLSAHRAHAHYLAKGGNLERFIAELYGKKTGCAGGRGGSMHLVDLDAGFLGCVPIVGSTISMAVGAAFGARQQNKCNITTVFLGDGATEEGVFYESLNFAHFQKLPVLFVCENNLYSVNTHYDNRRSSQRMADIVRGIGIEAISLDGQVCDEVFVATEHLVSRMRKSPQPFFLELSTYRYFEHCGPRVDPVRRPAAEVEFWSSRDPVMLCQQRLVDDGVLDVAAVREIRREISEEIAHAFAFAEESEFPARDELMNHIFADGEV